MFLVGVVVGFGGVVDGASGSPDGGARLGLGLGLLIDRCALGQVAHGSADEVGQFDGLAAAGEAIVGVDVAGEGAGVLALNVRIGGRGFVWSFVVHAIMLAVVMSRTQAFSVDDAIRAARRPRGS